MASQSVRFEYHPGLSHDTFSAARLTGSWDAEGKPSDQWTIADMAAAVDEGGRRFWWAAASLDPAFEGSTLRWGVLVDGPAGNGVWGIAAEVDDETSSDRTRSFVLEAAIGDQRYRLTWCGYLGARRVIAGGEPGIAFAAWAPNAKAVSLVIGDPAIGYVSDDGAGEVKRIAMRPGDDQIWRLDPSTGGALASFDEMVGKPYMFAVEKDDGSSAYRSDIWSLMQIGAGNVDPDGGAYAGPASNLDGPKSCSVVCDPAVVTDRSGGSVASEIFWGDEFDPARPLPIRIEDLVVYELHVGALGFGKGAVGTLDDAIEFVGYLNRLGVNAVELLPIAQFEDIASWGYGTSHFFAMDQAAGGTDRLKAFVKACHQSGIAVILDVCYNHFDPNGERAEWAYDSNDPTRNIYFWYEGLPSDYPDPSGGYIDNISTGYAPDYAQEAVRQLFISSAAFLVEVCHVDGFRLDQTSSIHQYPVVHANGKPAGRAAAFGTKFLKQWTRTMRLIKPGLFLSAEDYSDWPAMTQSSLDGDGLGFDVTWYADFHHNLVEYQNGSQAQLLKGAGYGDDRALAMDAFAGAVATSANAKTVYNACHDDVGNRDGSARTIVTAVNFAALLGDTRLWAEARVRFAAGMTLLSAGTAMFFMGEEVGATKPYRYDDFATNREDILGMASGPAMPLLDFYKDMIAFRRRHSALTSRNIAIATTHDANRVIAFHRWDADEAFLIVGSLANSAFASGYRLSDAWLGEASWREVFNSDAASYGGWNVGNGGATIPARNGSINLILPASGLIVLQKC